MKIRTVPAKSGELGHALVIVMVLGGISLFALSAVMSWTSGNAMLNSRNNSYHNAVAAAEAATEKVLAQLMNDYQEYGPGYVDFRVPQYRVTTPTRDEYDGWADYVFSDGMSGVRKTYVNLESPWQISPLVSQYQGLNGFAATYRITSHARDVHAGGGAIGAVQQDIQIASIPIFQFAIFYNMDLEINPGPDMTVAGRVHSNRHIYSDPGRTLWYQDDVTAAGTIIHERMPDDPGSPASGTIIYDGESDSGVNSLNLPIGTNNSPAAVRQIIAIPPSTESPTSQMGKQRMYNKADLVIMIKDTEVVAHGPVASGAPPISWASISSFVDTNKTFFNKREGKQIKATEVDVSALAAWSGGANPIRSLIGRDVNSIYVADLRTQETDTQQGVRLVNGATLPDLGLTVTTPDPLYVQGNYNATGSAVGSHDTANTKPAAFLADALSVLSTAWKDSNSTKSLGNRVAANTTVNAAFLSGIVQTTTSSYSGGVENFPRFLETWSGRKLTYNGSMIVMFPSEVAVAPWRGTGSSIGIYDPPTRDWSFDTAFLNPSRLPPGTPMVSTSIRGSWEVIAGKHEYADLPEE